MTSKSLLAASVAIATAFGSVSIASAQPAPTAVNHGPPIPGVCIFSLEAAVGSSTVGKYVGTRMQQIVAQVNAELNSEKTSLESEAKTLDGQSKSLDQATLQQRAQALNTRYQAFQQKAAVRDREIQATQQKALDRIATEIEPLAQQAYQAKNCSILFNGQAISTANPAMDITPQVVTALNAKITQFPFDRERLDQPGAASAASTAPAAVAPARPAPAKKK